MGNPFGRSTIVPLTNKSGGAVAAGDFVYIDTANNDSFTTGTTTAYTKGIGIAQATIASNAIGLVLIDGYASLVNVNASVTRGNFLKSHSVVKQGTDAGASRAAGTCGMFLTGGTTPDALIWQPDLGAASGMSDPMTTRGDMIYRNSSNTTDRLALPSVAGQVIGRVSSDIGSFYPPGYAFDYATVTSLVSITHTTEGTSDTIITGGSVSYDGSTEVIIEVYLPQVLTQATANASTIILLYEDSTLLGRIGIVSTPASANATRAPLLARLKRTPSNASHQYLVKATTTSGTGSAGGGAGGTGDYVAGYLRVIKS